MPVEVQVLSAAPIGSFPSEIELKYSVQVRGGAVSSSQGS